MLTKDNQTIEFRARKTNKFSKLKNNMAFLVYQRWEINPGIRSEKAVLQTIPKVKQFERIR
jgi:hypothetical protein